MATCGVCGLKLYQTCPYRLVWCHIGLTRRLSSHFIWWYSSRFLSFLDFEGGDGMELVLGCKQNVLFMTTFLIITQPSKWLTNMSACSGLFQSLPDTVLQMCVCLTRMISQRKTFWFCLIWFKKWWYWFSINSFLLSNSNLN